MTVRELYNWCKAFRHKEAEVYLVKDWEQCDDDGNLTDLYRLRSMCHQVVVIDAGMDFVDVTEALLEVEEEPAIFRINK